MASDAIFKQSDTADALVLYLREEDNSPLPDVAQATTIEWIMRHQTKPTHVIHGTMTVLDAPTAKVKYDWAEFDLDDVGLYDGVVRLTYPLSKVRTIPTEGFIVIEVTDTVEYGVVGEEIEMPPTTPTTYGTGQFPWTPTIVDGGSPVVGATVTVTPTGGAQLGPATTNANGQCVASDGLGAFRLNAGTYTMVATFSGVSLTRSFTLDSTGNEVFS